MLTMEMEWDLAILDCRRENLDRWSWSGIMNMEGRHCEKMKTLRVEGSEEQGNIARHDCSKFVYLLLWDVREGAREARERSRADVPSQNDPVA